MRLTKETRKRLILAGVVLICGVALMGLVYILFNKPEVYVSPGIVSKSPSLNSGHITPSSSLHRTTMLNRVKTYRPPKSSRRSPLASQPTFHIWTTSSQTAHEAGGGFQTGLYTTTHSSAPSRGITALTTGNTLSMGTFSSLASSRPLAQPEAQEAPMMAQLSVAPKQAPGPPTVGDLTDGDEHQLTEHPIGEGLWILLLMVMLYAFLRIRSKHVPESR